MKRKKYTLLSYGYMQQKYVSPNYYYVYKLYGPNYIKIVQSNLDNRIFYYWVEKNSTKGFNNLAIPLDIKPV